MTKREQYIGEMMRDYQQGKISVRDLIEWNVDSIIKDED